MPAAGCRRELPRAGRGRLCNDGMDLSSRGQVCFKPASRSFRPAWVKPIWVIISPRSVDRVSKNPQNETDCCQFEEDSARWGAAATSLKETNSDLRRRNEYLTALHETAIGLLNLLDKEELLETILYQAAL